MMLLSVVVVSTLLLLLSSAYAEPENFKERRLVDLFNCNNLCFKVNDGVCDDGGPGSTTGFCPYGSDCNDCGERAPYTRAPTARRVPTEKPTPAQATTNPTSSSPSAVPTRRPSTKSPTPKLKAVKRANVKRTAAPTRYPTRKTSSPSSNPTKMPTKLPSAAPSVAPSSAPSQQPSVSPTFVPSASPTVKFKCTSVTSKDKCCSRAQAAAGRCVFQGCAWSVQKSRCLPVAATQAPVRKGKAIRGSG